MGVLGGAATATAAPLLNDLQANLSNTLKQAGASDEVAEGIVQGISPVTAAGIGASVGMASGNGLAGAAAGVNVDANNRQLHPDDVTLKVPIRITGIQPITLSTSSRTKVATTKV